MKLPLIKKNSSYLLLLIGLLFSSQQAATQSNNSNQKYTISGYIKDAQNGEMLTGAYIYDTQNKTKYGTSTNQYGYYALDLPAGQYLIEASFIGFQVTQKNIEVTDNQVLNIELQPDGILLQNMVEVTATRKDKNVESTQMGVVDLPIEQIKAIPALMGEVDVIRSIQLLPGVLSSGEVNSGLYVRGGGPDQNLILLDEAVVYNTGHLFGFFSVFNADALKNTTLHKGGMPAEYGGRLSSVVDISMKDGNNKDYQFDGGLGLISSRLTVQGPLQKDKSSFLVAGRRTYADILARPLLKANDLEGNGYYFYDFNAKANYLFSDKDRVYLSGYFGRDVFTYKSKDGINLDMAWGNETATLRWNHLFNQKLFSNLSLIYNTYKFDVNSRFDEFESRFYSKIKDWNAKLDFDYFATPKHTIKFGANYTYHTFTPYTIAANVADTTEINTEQFGDKFSHEMALYYQSEFSIGQCLKVNAGLRASGYRQVGPSNELIINQQNIVTDTIFYGKGEKIIDYGGLEPRLSLRYALTPQSSLKASFVWSNQYIHLVSASTATLPTDLWVSSSKIVKPQQGAQYALGYFQNFLEDNYEASVEVYYRNLNNQIEFAENAVPAIGIDIENSFTFGTAEAYGLELFLKKRKGRFNGWIGYTLSRTSRLFEEINNGERFPAKYDRTHDLSIVAAYELNSRWQFGGSFVYGTGQALTLPNSFFIIGNWLYQEYDMPRNSYRLRPYHRLDFSATCRLGKRSKQEARANNKFYSELVFSVYNVYNRFNPFFVYAFPAANEDVAGAIDVKLKEVSIFPVVPSISWNFSF